VAPLLAAHAAQPQPVVEQREVEARVGEAWIDTHRGLVVVERSLAAAVVVEQVREVEIRFEVIRVLCQRLS
jgi:hypothetical protein